MPDKNTALIAMSGGVDSSVAAYIMKSRGFRCSGATMRLYKNADIGMDSSKTCCSQQDIEDAAEIAYRLDIPYEVLEYIDDFKKEIMEKFISVYESGGTPNPCIECNRLMKFTKMLEYADRKGIWYLVTGHYARVTYNEETGRYLLRKGLDDGKDQSYFLSVLSQEQLSRAQFPLGELTKEETRRIAAENGFVNARKHDSQDICFVPDGDYVKFMENYTGKRYPEGDFLDTDGNVVGRHRGAVGYTIGQRRGLDLAMGHRIYVCGKDMENNTVTVGENSDLYSQGLTASNVNWVSVPGISEPLKVKAKTRSRQKEQPATVYPDDGGIRVVFDEPQRAITVGQTVALYDGDTVVAAGTITGSF